jgi:hypothetical protein
MALSNWINVAKEYTTLGNRQDLTISFYEMKEGWSTSRDSFLNTGRCLDTEFGSWWESSHNALNVCDSFTIDWLNDLQTRVATYGDVTSVYVV